MENITKHFPWKKFSVEKENTSQKPGKPSRFPENEAPGKTGAPMKKPFQGKTMENITKHFPWKKFPWKKKTLPKKPGKTSRFPENEAPGKTGAPMKKPFQGKCMENTIKHSPWKKSVEKQNIHQKPGKPRRKKRFPGNKAPGKTPGPHEKTIPGKTYGKQP